jgi:hypothetical protein
MQINVLYLALISAGLAASSAINFLVTNSWINATATNASAAITYPSATSASTDTTSQLDITIWAGAGCKLTMPSDTL